MKQFVFVLMVFLSSCTSSFVERPVAYLVVDGKPHEMIAGSSCWTYSEKDSICDDVFATITQKGPVKISRESTVELRFRAKSLVRKVYLESTNTDYLTLGKPLEIDSEDPEEQEYFQHYFENHSVWDVKKEFESEFEKHRESRMKKLSPKPRQFIENDLEPGQYVLSVGTWWANGDASFDILVLKE